MHPNPDVVTMIDTERRRGLHALLRTRRPSRLARLRAWRRRSRSRGAA